MGHVARFLVKDGLGEHFDGERHFLDLGVDVAQVGAVSIVGHRTFGGEHGDGIGVGAQVGVVVEERLVGALDGDAVGVGIQQAHAGKDVAFAAGVFLIADDMLILAGLRTELRHLVRGAQQVGEHVVRRGDGRFAVGIDQVILKGDGVDGVGAVRRAFDGLDDHVIKHEFDLRIPDHGAVAVDHGAHVDIAGIVAPHAGEEIAAHFGGVAHGDMRRFLAHGTAGQGDLRGGKDFRAFQRFIAFRARGGRVGGGGGVVQGLGEAGGRTKQLQSQKQSHQLAHRISSDLKILWRRHEGCPPCRRLALLS